MATGSAEAELVEVSPRSHTRLSDGSLQVTFENGRSVIVPEGDWTIVDGRIYIEERVLGNANASATDGGAASGGFLGGVSPWALLGGGLAAGYAVNELLNDDDSAPATLNISPSGTTLTGNISNASSASNDDAGTVVIADVSPIFKDAGGTVTYTYEVTDSSGAVVTDLVYMNGSQILILDDPEVADNGVYTITITATDSAGGDTAQAAVFVTVDVESEASQNGSIANVTMDENDAANDVVVSDIAVFFQDAEGSFSYDVVVSAGGQDFGNVLTLNGTSLVLANDVTDDFVEFLNGVAGDEDIIFTVQVTATDSADGTVLTQTFALTLDATGVNDAPVLATGASSTQIVNIPDVTTSDAISFDLSAFVEDEENDTILWSITTDPTTNGLSIDASGLLTGTADLADDGLLVEIEATDADNPGTPVSFSVYLDVA